MTSTAAAMPPASLTLRVSLHWDARMRGVGLCASSVRALGLEASAAATATATTILRVAASSSSAAAAADLQLPAVLLPLLVDPSVPEGVALLPLGYAQLMGWRAGTTVLVTTTSPASAAASKAPRLPTACRVLAHVWKPSVAVRVEDGAPPASSGSDVTPSHFASATLGDLLHLNLLRHPRVHLPAVSISTSTAALADFRIMHWKGLVCLARIHRLISLVLSDSSDEEAEEEEEDVTAAVVDEDTEVECEVVSDAPVFYTQPASLAAVPSPSHLPPLFPHMLPNLDASADLDDTSFAGCFPKEWKTLQQFVHNALQSRASSSTPSAASSSSSTALPSALFGFGWSIPRALLVAGMTGAGKSSLLDAFTSSVNPNEFVIHRVTGGSMLNQGSSDNILQLHSSLLRELAPSGPDAKAKTGILVLEDADPIICGTSHIDLSTQLLTLLDRLASASSSPSSPLVLLVASVKNLDSVPSHFLSTGKLEATCKFGLLSNEQRRRIVKGQLRQVQAKVDLDPTHLPQQATHVSASFVADATQSSSPGASDLPLDRFCSALSGFTPGYVAADLAKLVQYTLLHAGLRWDASSATESQQPFSLTWKDFEAGMKQTHPSNASTPSAALRLSDTDHSAAAASATTGAPSAAVVDAWPTVGGYDLLKKRLDLTLYHWLHPARIQVLGLRPISGILFHGPSGCGKSLLASSLARHAGLNFVSVSVASVFSQYLGESERKIRALFTQAQQLAPCVLLLDHVEALAGKRDGQAADGAQGVDQRVLSTLLNEMDGISKRAGVYVVGCTSNPNALDSALMRPGRFDDVIEVGLPVPSDREAILRLQTRRVNLASCVDLAEIAEETEGFTGADLADLISRAGMAALRANVKADQVTRADLLAAIASITGVPIRPKIDQQPQIELHQQAPFKFELLAPLQP